MEIFRAEKVTKRYANHLALNEVSISVPEGSIFGLLGPNGAGKTTLIRIINRIIAPDSGKLFLQNRKLSKEHTPLIGYLPEERGLYKKMKVGEQALYLARLKGMKKQDALEKLKIWFAKFEITDWWNKKVEELSKGMQQKVQFIVTVIHEPKLLIFDEPFSGFDPINVNLLKEEILRIRENGATIIFSTHNMASVEELCDHIALINKSEKILDGSVKEIKKSYRTNLFEIEFSNEQCNPRTLLPANFEIIEQHKDDGKISVRIKIPESVSPNDLLKLFLPETEIYSFNEILPTMNDIFIRKVNEFNN